MAEHTMRFPDGDKDKTSLLYLEIKGKCEGCGNEVVAKFDLGQVVAKLDGIERIEPEKPLDWDIGHGVSS